MNCLCMRASMLATWHMALNSPVDRFQTQTLDLGRLARGEDGGPGGPCLFGTFACVPQALPNFSKFRNLVSSPLTRAYFFEMCLEF